MSKETDPFEQGIRAARAKDLSEIGSVLCEELALANVTERGYGSAVWTLREFIREEVNAALHLYNLARIKAGDMVLPNAESIKKLTGVNDMLQARVAELEYVRAGEGQCGCDHAPCRHGAYRILKERDDARNERDDLRNMVAAWQEASGLVDNAGYGNPGGVAPDDARAYWEKVEKDRDEWEATAQHVNKIADERDALRARVAKLEQGPPPTAERQTVLLKDCRRFEARVVELETLNANQKKRIGDDDRTIRESQAHARRLERPLSTLLHWYDEDGKPDASWWEKAREVLKRGPGGEQPEPHVPKVDLDGVTEPKDLRYWSGGVTIDDKGLIRSEQPWTCQRCGAEVAAEETHICLREPERQPYDSMNPEPEGVDDYIPTDLRPTCIRCSQRWTPAEGVDARETPCPACVIGLAALEGADALSPESLKSLWRRTNEVTESSVSVCITRDSMDEPRRFRALSQPLGGPSVYVYGDTVEAALEALPAAQLKRRREIAAANLEGDDCG